MVIFTLFYCLFDMSCGVCDLISLYFMCCFVCLVCWGVVVILLLNVMEVFSVGRPCGLTVWIDRVCACCICDPSVLLSVPSIGFVYDFISHHLRV